MLKCYHRRLTVSDKAGKSRRLHDVRAAFTEARQSQYAEIWIDYEDYPAMCALVNGSLGWLMYLRYDGDTGFSTRNPAYEGPPDAVVDYFLSNGQRDQYPASWAYPVEEVIQALEWFAAKKEHAILNYVVQRFGRRQRLAQ
jgi:hypothetical protein